MKTALEQACTIVEQGGIVIFPTDTAFGIGCRIDNEKAVERLFAIRKRPLTQATPVLIDTVTMAKKYTDGITQAILDTLIEPYWPGALTIVLPAYTERVPALVRGGGNTIGLRIPHHPTPRHIVRTLGIPILGPSANFHGESTPYAFEDLHKELIGKVDYVVPGECSLGQASTVIDCTQTPWKVLREGAVHLSL